MVAKCFQLYINLCVSRTLHVVNQNCTELLSNKEAKPLLLSINTTRSFPGVKSDIQSCDPRTGALLCRAGAPCKAAEELRKKAAENESAVDVTASSTKAIPLWNSRTSLRQEAFVHSTSLGRTLLPTSSVHSWGAETPLQQAVAPSTRSTYST